MVAGDSAFAKTAALVPLFGHLLSNRTQVESEDWYRHAVNVLRGGDGGEHGLILYKHACEAAERECHVIALDVGTARGFSALVSVAGDQGRRIVRHCVLC